MLFKKVVIEGVGPISNLEFEFPRDNQKPMPLVIVGENGSGKSILLSHLVNSLISGKQSVYDDVEVEKGKVFKYRSPTYIKSGEHYSYSSVEFDSGEKVQEWQLVLSKSEFEDKLKYTPLRSEWNQIPDHENSLFQSTFNPSADGTKSIFKNQCCLYFPVNRFEEPAWLNIENLQSKASYTDLKRISGYSNRDLICTSPLKSNINWLLDVVLDRQAFEIQTNIIRLPVPEGQPSPEIPVFGGYSGQSSKIYEAIISVLKVILRQEGNVRLGIGTRHNRQISVMRNDQPWIPNLFQLSTGEVQLVNLFLSIIRDYDLSEGKLNDLSDIKGVVVIDEIDSHLHTSHQREILPELIKSFPNVQFVVTTHAPLFLIGMEEAFGEKAFEVINLPMGERVSSNDFSEFIAAYDAFKETAKHRAEIKRQIETHAKPIVFVEGDYDIRYLLKAAELLGRESVLGGVQLKDGVGFGNLDKVWRAYNNSVSEVLPAKIVLLYDCDTNKENSNKNKIYKRVIPCVEENPIESGIENLFPPDTIEKIEEENPQYIDVHQAVTTRIRGQMSEKPSYKTVNRNEKRNMCDWLCEHGDVQDFVHFQSVFDIIEEVAHG